MTFVANGVGHSRGEPASPSPDCGRRGVSDVAPVPTGSLVALCYTSACPPDLCAGLFDS